MQIASYAATSPATSLDWHTLQYEFSGNGQARTIRILTEATEITSNGRGAMIDNIALIEATPINSGFMDAPIRLATIHAALSDPDGSETPSVAIASLPAGARLSDGSHTFIATADNGRADVTAWDLAQLSLLPPSGFVGSIHLYVEATATEWGNGASASTTATLMVVVFPTSSPQ